MPVRLIVSYDGTANDDDALMLGRMLAEAGATLSLAYVRHAREQDPRREEIAQHDARRRLAQGAAWLEEPEIDTHVVLNRSTGAGLAELAAGEGAAVLVFGSDYRTPPGHVEPQGSAQGLLEGGRVAVAVAAAGLRTSVRVALSSIAVVGDMAGDAARTADEISAATGAPLVADGRIADLTIIDSRPDAPPGRVALDGATRSHLNSARGSVLILPRGGALTF